ncbi:glycoside hydrolase family 16 protein [Mycena crocata]|nr:glycoside hydrolase family 16 protein [Mycena crocata]
MSKSSRSRTGYKREASPNLLPKPDDWVILVRMIRDFSHLHTQFSLSPDPALWGSNLSSKVAEPDDGLHNPEAELLTQTGAYRLGRGLANVGCLVLLSLAIVALFLGYPVAKFVGKTLLSGGGSGASVNATGQVASIGNFGLIDLETPADAYNIKSLYSGKDMTLVFSDEFNTDGRSFYPGDDPYWEAVDLHYWATNNMEWYDPSAVTTANGSLKITLSATQNHDLNYTGGENKFCFTGGLIVAAATLPGTNNIHGLWPALWTMGNLGRAGYGASLDGTWPSPELILHSFTYDTCDVGTAPNQTRDGRPEIALTSGHLDEPFNGELSYQPGQRLSRCTCPGESHPGPIHMDGSYVGRAAPEIDIFEAQVANDLGAVSQSGQWAPFNAGYVWLNDTDNLVIADPEKSFFNTYIGGAYQQATSVVTQTNQGCYELLDGCLSVYGIEYISWITDNKLAWTIHSAGLAADPKAEIAARPVPQEPMYILANLGMSRNFGAVDLDHLVFPTTLSVDYIRVYQYPDSINIGCDPPDFPTQEYINTYIEAYTNPLLTTWIDDYNQTMPKNSFMGACSPAS